MNSDKLYYQDLMDFRDSAIKGLTARESKLKSNKQTLTALSTSDKFKGKTADSIRDYIKEVHLSLIKDLLEVKSMLEKKFNTYVAGYPSSVDIGGVNFKLDTKDYKALTKNITTDYEKIEELKSKVESIEDSVADLVSVDPSPYPGLAMDLLTDCKISYINKQSNNWTSYESSFQGQLDDVENALNQSKQMIAQFSDGTVPSLGEYPAGLFNKLADVGLTEAYGVLYTEEKNPDFQKAVKESNKALKAEKATLTSEQNARVANFWVDAAFFAVSAVAFVATAGAATPIVAMAGTSLLFSASNLVEAKDQMDSKGENDFNPVRDWVFQKNQNLYTATNFAVDVLSSKGAYETLAKDGVFVAAKADAKPILKVTVEDLAENGAKSATKTAINGIKASAMPHLSQELTKESATKIVAVYTKETAKQEINRQVKPLVSQVVAEPIASQFASKDSLTYDMVKDVVAKKVSGTKIGSAVAKGGPLFMNYLNDAAETGGYMSSYNNSLSLLGGQR